MQKPLRIALPLLVNAPRTPAPVKSGAFMDRGRTLWVGDGSAVAHPL